MARARLSRRAVTATSSRRSLVLRVALVVVAAVAALAPTDPRLVERAYSRSVYPALQPVVTSVSSLAPFALLDAWLVIALVVCAVAVWRVTRAAKGTRGRAAIASVGRGLAAAAALYVVFLALWGLNYRRTPITDGLAFDRSRVTPARVEAFTLKAVDELNALHAPAHAELAAATTWAAARARLAPAFGEAQRALGRDRLTTPGRPKVSMLSPYFRWASVDGMVNPFGLEVLVNPDVLPVEFPFVLAHEWGHLAGARLGGALVHPPERAATVFLFNFDSDRNDRRAFLWMSCGGFLASALGLALLLAVLPLAALAGRVALGLALLGVLATAVLELPPFFRVARCGPIPRGLGYRASERGGAPA
jgi:hypothetical protein